MYTRVKTIFLSLIVTAMQLTAQGIQPVHPQNGHRPEWPPTGGTALLTLDPPPGNQPTTLANLESRSSIIADAVVETVMPSRVLNRMLETDVILSATQILKGPAAVKEILVTQRGGTVGAFKQQPLQYSMMQKGERYLLFVTTDKRTNMPSVLSQSGAPLTRYWIIGEWVGAVHADAGIVHFNKAVFGDLRQQYEGTSTSQLAAAALSLSPKVP